MGIMYILFCYLDESISILSILNNLCYYIMNYLRLLNVLIVLENVEILRQIIKYN